jgi:SRSO17 transposase
VETAQLWERLQGARVFGWRPPPCPKTAASPLGWSRYLLVRRSLTRNGKDEHELACYLLRPGGTADEELIRVAGSRWPIGECFQDGQNETGLDQYQVRRYDAWYRHITLAMLARAYLSVTAATAPKALAATSSRSCSARSAVSWHT